MQPVRLVREIQGDTGRYREIQGERVSVQPVRLVRVRVRVRVRARV